MMRALWRDGAIYTLGTLVTRGLGLLLLPLYTRALTPAEFGLLDLILTAGVLLNLVVPLETPQAVARFWNEREPGAPRRTLAGTGLLFALLGYGLLLLLGWSAAGALAQALGAGAADAGAVLAGLAAAATNGVLIVLQGQFRWALRVRAYALSAAAFGVLTLGGIAALVLGGRASVAGVLWVQAAAAAVVALASAAALTDDIAWRLNRAELARLLRFSLPLVPAGVAVFAALYLQRFVLGAYAPLDEVGRFGTASRIASIATLLLIGVQGALTPLVYAHHADPRTPARLARLLEGFAAAAMLACLALALFGAELLAVLASEPYVAAAPLLAWLAPAALLGQMYVFAPGIPLARKTAWQLGLTVAAAALGLTLAMVLVPRWQSLGAAVSVTAAAACFFGAWLALGQRLYPLPLRTVPLALGALAFVVLLATGPRLVAAVGGGVAGAWTLRLGLLVALALVLVAAGLLRPPGRDDGEATAGGTPAASGP